MFKSTLCFSAAVAFASSSASGAIVFNEFFDGQPIDDQDSAVLTEADPNFGTVNLTVDSGVVSDPSGPGRFAATGSGLGFRGTSPGNNFTQIDRGDSFTLSFDQDGVIDSFSAQQFPGTSELIFANTTAGTATTVNLSRDSGGQTQFDDVPLGLAFEANDVLTLTNNTTAGDTGISNNGIRLQDLTVTVVPEPASLALLGAGGLLMARRRR